MDFAKTMIVKNIEHQKWFQDEMGAKLISVEKHELIKSLSKMYGYHLAFLGEPELCSLIEESPISHRILLNAKCTTRSEEIEPIQGDWDAIPLCTDSIDVVVLAHALEHVADPHEVLRESHRVLIPEGHIIITGFNPYSLWGAWHTYLKWNGKVPSEGKMLTPNRIVDWLTLLNFQIIGSSLFSFRPPFGGQQLYERLAILEKWGEKAFPFLGGAYMLIAVKRVIPLTLMRTAKYKEKRLWEGVTEGFPKPTASTLRNTKKSSCQNSN